MTLYVSDLDGTLLNGRAELSAVSRNMLNDMIADGLSFTVATARSVSSIRPLLDGLDLSLPVIEFNGAFISDLKTGRHEITNAIDPSITSDLYHLLSKGGCAPFLSTFNGEEDCLYHPEPTNAGSQWYFQEVKHRRDPRLRQSDDIAASLLERVVCFTSIGREDELTELAARVLETFGESLELHLFENPYSPGWHWFTAHDHRATKDQAISTLMKAYGLEERPLVVFGDQLNDLKMFSIADESVAVDNAVAQLKEKATVVIGRNDQDSVAKFIHEHRHAMPTAKT